MAANSIVTAQTLKTGHALATAAKTTYNDTTNAVLLYTAGSSGGMVTKLEAIPRATITATQAMIFASVDGGVTLYLKRTILIAAHTVQTTTQIPNNDFGWSESDPLRLAANERLYCAISVALAGGVAFNAEGEDL